MKNEEKQGMGSPVFPIVVVTYNRPESLRRLLGSLRNSQLDGEVPLIISIDGGADPQTVSLAESFEWPHGPKRVRKHDANLGLRKHILECGDISQEYDGAIILEDDLFVSPHFYRFALAAARFYGDDDRLAGISLYAHGYNETAQFPFEPLDDGFDTFFMQYASSWGQLWTRQQWKKFQEWYETNGKLPIVQDGTIPVNLMLWPDSSWKKYFIQYLIKTNRYFVFPRVSLTTNFCEIGKHLKYKEHFLQEPLLMKPMEYRFGLLEESLARYDAHCEIRPEVLKSLNPALSGYDFATDLYGTRPVKEMKDEFILTSRPAGKAAMSFGRELKPHEANVVFGIPGDRISLCRREDVSDSHFIVKMLRAHRMDLLVYYYKLRLYHFYRKEILANPSEKGYSPRFTAGKFFSMSKFMLGRMKK